MAREFQLKNTDLFHEADIKHNPCYCNVVTKRANQKIKKMVSAMKESDKIFRKYVTAGSGGMFTSAMTEWLNKYKDLE